MNREIRAKCERVVLSCAKRPRLDSKPRTRSFSLNPRVAVPTTRASAVEGGGKTLASRAGARGESDAWEHSEKNTRNSVDPTRHGYDVSPARVYGIDQVGEFDRRVVKRTIAETDR